MVEILGRRITGLFSYYESPAYMPGFFIGTVPVAC